jgi:hypothetical protein
MEHVGLQLELHSQTSPAQTTVPAGENLAGLGVGNRRNSRPNKQKQLVPKL